MTDQKIEDAIELLDRFDLLLSHAIPRTAEEEIAFEDACADAARLVERLRQLREPTTAPTKTAP